MARGEVKRLETTYLLPPPKINSFPSRLATPPPPLALPLPPPSPSSPPSRDGLQTAVCLQRADGYSRSLAAATSQ